MSTSEQLDDASLDRADRVARQLAVPVLLASLAAIPAVFLTLFEDPWARVGAGLNVLSGAVLLAETVVLFALAEDRRAWLRRNRWLVVLAGAILVAVVFALGPVQLLRLVRAAGALRFVRLVGALRIVRVGRILKAGRILRERAGLDHGWQRVLSIGVSVLCAAFVGLVLADPTSTSRQLLDDAVQRLGVLGVLVAGGLLGAATYVVRSRRRSPDDEDPSAHRSVRQGP